MRVFAYNTFPLMDGDLVPDGYADLTPFLRNLTGNIAAVQFDHRLLATLTVLMTAGTVALGFAVPAPLAVRLPLAALGLTTAVQYGLGIATLLLVVPVGLAAAHQANAILVLTAALVLLARASAPACGCGENVAMPPGTPSPDGGFVVGATDTDIAAAGQALPRIATTVETPPLGLAVFGAAGTLAFANAHFTELLDLPPDPIRPGMSLGALLDLMAGCAEFAGADGAAFVAAQRDLDRSRSAAARRLRGNGRTANLSSDPLPDGGWIMAVADITPVLPGENEASRQVQAEGARLPM